MDEQQKPQNTTPITQQSTPNFMQATLPPDPRQRDNSISLLVLLTLAFCFGIPFVGLLIQEILDTSYDGGGLGYLILFVFFLPPFLLFGIASAVQAVKMKSNGQKIGMITLKAFLLAFVSTALLFGVIFLEKVWDSFF